MSETKTIVNAIGTLICLMIAIFFGAFVPYKIVTSENHFVIGQIFTLRFIGPILIFIGTIGYLMCFWNFIFNAKGTPLPNTQHNLIVNGLYRYVRNPMYISWHLIILGESLFFCSLHLLFYLFAWIVFFHFYVIIFEETWLKDQFGKSYEEYCKSVRRWIPRLKAYTIETN